MVEGRRGKGKRVCMVGCQPSPSGEASPHRSTPQATRFESDDRQPSVTISSRPASPELTFLASSRSFLPPWPASPLSPTSLAVAVNEQSPAQQSVAVRRRAGGTCAVEETRKDDSKTQKGDRSRSWPGRSRASDLCLLRMRLRLAPQPRAFKRHCMYCEQRQ